MHTSANEYGDAAWRWAEQCHSVPSPLVGPCGGRDRERGRTRTTSLSQIVREFVSEASLELGFSSAPPSLSLPHKGGGNRGALTFATHAMCPRMDFQRCVHALALPPGRAELRGDS